MASNFLLHFPKLISTSFKIIFYLVKEMHIRAGDWKLAGLEYVCAAGAQPPAKILPCLEKYVAPVRSSQFPSHLTFQLDQVRPSRKKGPIQSKVGHSLGRRYLGSWVPNLGGGSIFYF